MAPRRRANCQICNQAESKYACPKCEVLYCSVPCYKHHKSHSCSASASTSGTGTNTSRTQALARTEIQTAEPLSLYDDTQVVPDGQRKEIGRNKKCEGDATAIVALPSSFPSSQVRQEGGDVIEVEVGAKVDMANAESSHLGVYMEADDSRSDSEARVGDVDVEIAQTQNRNVLLAGNRTEIDTGHVKGGEAEEEAEAERDSLNDSDNLVSQSPLEAPRPLRKLSSLKWPYVPEAPSYPDPLTRDDPKPLTLTQYEAIARSPAIRCALASHARLPKLLSVLDALRGPARERALERALGVAPSQSTSFSLADLPSSTPASTFVDGRETEAASSVFGLERGIDEEDMKALRELAEAVEAAVRSSGGAEGRFGADPLGLDWEG